MTYGMEIVEVQQGKRPLEIVGEEEEGAVMKQPKYSEDEVHTTLSIGGFLKSAPDPDHSSSQRHNDDNSDTESLIVAIGPDNSINCLLLCSRADYGSISLLNSSFRSLVRSGDLYRLRRRNGIVEHWVYFSCQLLEWEVFDPVRRHWMHLPRMFSNECFVFADKESLAVGTDLLVFGRDNLAHVIYQYSLLTNSWTSGTTMNHPRCLFGSASIGEIAILAGGCDMDGKIVSSAELYNSDSKTWKTLPSMNKARKMSSAVFMDGKFYVIGGVGAESKFILSGEEYNLENGIWTEIPNMSPLQSAERANVRPAISEAPPLIAVAKNELYAADYADMTLKKYKKDTRVWVTLGKLPEHAGSMYGWGLAFRACGDRLLVIGGPHSSSGGVVEVNSWIPDGGPPQWEVLGYKRSACFIYNCAVMGC